MRALIAFAAILLITSCGGGGGIEGAGEFTSTVVNISGIVPSKLESDVVIKLDNDGDKLCDGISFQDDTIVVKIVSRSITSNEQSKNFSPVIIDKYRIKFFNASAANNCEKNNICKSLFSHPIERFVNISVDPNGEALLPISVIPADWKSNVLINFCSSVTDSCVYNALIELHAVEIYSGKENWIKGTLTIQIADYMKSNSVTIDEQGKIVQNAKEDANCVFDIGR